jgi:hypothetical protein
MKVRGAGAVLHARRRCMRAPAVAHECASDFLELHAYLYAVHYFLHSSVVLVFAPPVRMIMYGAGFEREVIGREGETLLNVAQINDIDQIEGKRRMHTLLKAH